MKNLIILFVLLFTLPVFSKEIDMYGIPICENEFSYNCRIKSKDFLKWYKIDSNGFSYYQFLDSKFNQIYYIGYGEPFQSYEIFLFNLKDNNLNEYYTDLEYIKLKEK